MSKRNKTWVVTGYSGKQDGTLVVVKAKNEKEAVEKAVKACFVPTMVASRQTSPNGDEGWFTHEKERETSWGDGDVGWDWQLFVGEVREDGRANEAVCW